jgi:hypothetical protein
LKYKLWHLRFAQARQYLSHVRRGDYWGVVLQNRKRYSWMATMLPVELIAGERNIQGDMEASDSMAPGAGEDASLLPKPRTSFCSRVKAVWQFISADSPIRRLLILTWIVSLLIGVELLVDTIRDVALATSPLLGDGGTVYALNGSFGIVGTTLILFCWLNCDPRELFLHHMPWRMDMCARYLQRVLA